MKVWFHGVAPDRKVAGIQSLRKVAQILVDKGELEADRVPPYATLEGATECWLSLARTSSMLLGFSTDNPETLAACVEALERGGILHSTTSDSDFPARPQPAPNPDGEATGWNPAASEPLPEPPQPDKFLPAVDACQVAAVLLASADGNSGAALMLARSLQRVLIHDEIWEEVSDFLLKTFPPMSGQELQHLLSNGPRKLA